MKLNSANANFRRKLKDINNSYRKKPSNVSVNFRRKLSSVSASFKSKLRSVSASFKRTPNDANLKYSGKLTVANANSLNVANSYKKKRTDSIVSLKYVVRNFKTRRDSVNKSWTMP